MTECDKDALTQRERTLMEIAYSQGFGDGHRRGLRKYNYDNPQPRFEDWLQTKSVIDDESVEQFLVRTI